MMFVILLFVLSMSHGFLLHTNSPLNSGTQTAGNQQYITKSELYDTQNHLQNEVNFVRNEINFVQNDMNKKLDLLTSQLQQILDSLQQQIAGQRCHNDSKAAESLGLYNEVVENYTKLQDKFESLQINYFKQEIELQLVRNETKELKDEIANLNSLNNINQLIDFRLLQKEVQSIGSQTHSLAVNDQARIQDFQALYNSFKEHELNEGGIIRSINLTLYQIIQSSEITNNDILSNVSKEMEQLRKSLNVSFLGIHQQIAKNSEKVALTACAELSEYISGLHPVGYIIKYGDIRTHVNVNNLSSFISSGKFTCEKEGLYLVSAWDLSSIAGSTFSIYKNGNSIASAYVTGSNDFFYSATAVVVAELLPNDTVWVQVIARLYVAEAQRSCLTLVKVK